MKHVLGVTLLVFMCASSVSGRVGGGDVLFSLKKGGNVTFSHDNHVSGVGLSCTACHPTPYTTTEKRKRATMAEMQKGKSCGLCHQGKQAFSVKGDCQKCHSK